jgi:hypothetical protein
MRRKDFSMDENRVKEQSNATGNLVEKFLEQRANTRNEVEKSMLLPILWKMLLKFLRINS